MTEEAKGKHNWGGFIGVMFGGCVGGFVGTYGLGFGFVMLEFGRNIAAGKTAALPPNFGNQNDSSLGMTLVFFPIVSLVCLVCGCLFLSANQQSGFAKYRSAAITGALILTVPTILPLLSAAMSENKLAETLAFAIPPALAGSTAAVAFLAVVQLLDRQGEFFKPTENKETP